ncbi:MAG: FeoB-associated Cys-rich membrane protein [Clostridia bacterium]|nr:FeoB-associated Cys-rich membrane protein [Clostridia bacterium]
MDWNLPTILVLAAVVLAMVAAIFAIVKNRKNPCSFCDGNCSSCSQKKSK